VGRPADDRFHVLTIGHVNANKRPESVIAAISASEMLRTRARYHLVGAIAPEMKSRLGRRADELGVALEIAGEVDDETLQRAIREADVVSCLRFPSLEAASASTIEAMLHGKAIVVTDVGFYRDLPSDCVRKISPDRELPDLQHELESLFADERGRSALGRRARAWAEKTFTSANYAKQLVATCVAAAKVAPLVQASAVFGNTLAEWGAEARSIEWLAAAAAWDPGIGSGRSE
jgi:glycosyltransferase involved in cell wall biosynthesis